MTGSEFFGLVVDGGLLIVSGILILALVAALVEMLRTRRRQYALVAVAALAWFLSSWALIANRYTPLRDALGSWTLSAVVFASQVTFVLLTVIVFRAVWGWPKLPWRFRTRRSPKAPGALP
jgi:hypothetical protein